MAVFSAPAMEAVVIPYSMASAHVTLNVYGYDSATLLDVEQDLIELLSNVNGITDVEGSTGETVPEAKVTVGGIGGSNRNICPRNIAQKFFDFLTDLVCGN